VPACNGFIGAAFRHPSSFEGVVLKCPKRRKKRKKGGIFMATDYNTPSIVIIVQNILRDKNAHIPI